MDHIKKPSVRLFQPFMNAGNNLIFLANFFLKPRLLKIFWILRILVLEPTNPNQIE